VEGKEEAKKKSSLKLQKGLSVLFILISLVLFWQALSFIHSHISGFILASSY